MFPVKWVQIKHCNITVILNSSEVSRSREYQSSWKGERRASEMTLISVSASVVCLPDWWVAPSPSLQSMSREIMLLSLFMSLFNNGGPRLCLHIYQGLHECRVLRWGPSTLSFLFHWRKLILKLIFSWINLMMFTDWLLVLVGKIYLEV